MLSSIPNDPCSCFTNEFNMTTIRRRRTSLSKCNIERSENIYGIFLKLSERSRYISLGNIEAEVRCRPAILVAPINFVTSVVTTKPRKKYKAYLATEV